MHHHAFPHGITRTEIISWYRRARRRTREIFDIVDPEAFYDRPIPLRNPIIFYEGHLPGFNVNTLVKLALGRKGVDERLEMLFARGIDPDSEASVADPREGWPAREDVQAFAGECDALVEAALISEDLENARSPHLRNGDAVFVILEHELMHQETLLYMLHNLPFGKKRPPRTMAAAMAPGMVTKDTVRIPAGSARLGSETGEHFGWDNEFPSISVDVAEFEIGRHNVTNGEYLEFVERTGAGDPHFWMREGGQRFWRGMYAASPLNVDAPVYVTHDEAAAYADWKGMRLPTEAEYHRAAYGSPGAHERRFPWGDEEPSAAHGNFDFVNWDPVPIGSYPAAVSGWGVHDLVGNGWEWTSTIFEGFPGFEPMPSYPPYSKDFFDGAHFVMKGASPVTARELVRPGFRNWFRPDYPYVYATFRCVR